MNKKIAFLFPGQGAQYVGMGRDFWEAVPKAKEVFEMADELLEEPFSELIFDGPSEELTLTKNSQLAIFITSIAILRAVQELDSSLSPTAVAGLSLGEYTALVAANVLTFEEALLIVRARGQYMHTACETHPGSMHVVLGLDLDAVKQAIAGIEGVWVANLNCPGQIVLSGTHDGLEKVGPLLKEAGARRVMPLDVSGAFHSGLMQEAQDKLKPLIEEAAIQEPSATIYMNVPGTTPKNLDEIRSNLTSQVTQSVLWHKEIEEMVKEGIELFIEMGPGKTLAGMNKRIGVSVPTISVEKIEDLSQMQGVYDAANA